MATPWSVLRGSWHADMKKNQDRVIEAIRRGDFVKPELRTFQITHPTDPQLTAAFQGMADVLKIGTPDDFVRVTVSHRTAQAIADLLGLVMPTAKLVDMNDTSALNKVEPGNWLKTEGAPSSVTEMVNDSESIDKMVSKPHWLGTPWKLWINHPRLANPQAEILGRRLAINYGGYTKRDATPKGVPGPKPAESRAFGLRVRNVYQEPGGFHDIDHVDESQKFWGLNPLVVIDWHGVADVIPLEKMGQNPDLWPLVSNTGPILMRHPWLPVCKALDEGGGCIDFTTGGGGSVPPFGGVPPTQGKRLAASLAVVVLAGMGVYALNRWVSIS